MLGSVGRATAITVQRVAGSASGVQDEDGGEVAGCGCEHESVPDRALKAQRLPEVEDHAC